MSGFGLLGGEKEMPQPEVQHHKRRCLWSEIPKQNNPVDDQFDLKGTQHLHWVPVVKLRMEEYSQPAYQCYWI